MARGDRRVELEHAGALERAPARERDRDAASEEVRKVAPLERLAARGERVEDDAAGDVLDLVGEPAAGHVGDEHRTEPDVFLERERDDGLAVVRGRDERGLLALLEGL